ncbi:MAG TPA: right-handed parallel beta-helix repeat-containing protein [Bryobacteraceae bacterium]
MGALAVVLLSLAFLTACTSSSSGESRIRRMLASQKTGTIRLPPGTIEISSELDLAAGAHDLEISGSGTTLKASPRFHGRAILAAEGARRIRFHDFKIEGDPSGLAKPLPMAPPENAFRIWYPNNGLLFDRVQGLEISIVFFVHVAGFPILVSRSSNAIVSQVAIEDSGSLNKLGRNNLSGGILIEEGSSNFEVRNSSFIRIAGNALWTHSLFTSPRLHDGLFAHNVFYNIGRDAIQVGHASRVRVEDNRGSDIGDPVQVVDVENGGTPVAIDTSGNVDSSVYAGNQFEEVDGKCIDLDGFHDGQVRENRCVNRKRAEDYPFGHFGIVMNDTDPNSRAQNVEITGNTIDGVKFGGLFLMGAGHRVEGNRFLNLNLAGCNESAARFGCIYKQDEPEMLETGIYLGRGVARLEETRANTIRGNLISGHGMANRCIQAGPGVSLAANTIDRNRCWDADGR